MLLNKLGEFGLIKRFQRKIKTDASVIKGSGDDCAVLALDKGHYQLFTCDMLVEGRDFTSQTDLSLAGRKALAVSISDIASCAGIPRYAVISLGLPEKISVEKVDKISQGIFSLAREYKINIVGGDLSSADKIIIDVAMLGVVEKKNLCLRQGAKTGDLSLVSAPLGGSIREKHLKFTPRLKEARFLVKQVKVNAMIDISDGLVQDLGHILETSQAGAVLYEEFIPLSRAARGLDDALYSGEDFELLFTLSPRAAKKLCRQREFNFKPIGQIMPKGYGLKIINRENKAINLKIEGYNHFK